MTLHPATAADSPLILSYLQATPLPPYMREEHVTKLLSEPGWVVMIDDVTQCVAAVVASNTQRSPTRIGAGLGVVDIPWLLPRASWTVNNVDDIAWVLLAALKKVVVRFPASASWPCGGEFEGEVVSNPALRKSKSREIGRFWGARYGLTIETKDLPSANLVRSEAASVSHLISKFSAYFAHPHG